MSIRYSARYIITTLCVTNLLMFSSVGFGAESGLIFGQGRGQSSDTNNTVFLKQLPVSNQEVGSSFQMMVGRRSFERLYLSNVYYDFFYPAESDVSFVSVGLEVPALQTLLGGFSMKAGLSYTYYPSSRLRLHILPLTAGVVYVADATVLASWITPTVEVGGGYHAYFQNGDIDGAQAKGGSWMLHVATGLRHSLQWVGLEHSKLLLEYRRITGLDAQDYGLASQALSLGIGVEI